MSAALDQRMLRIGGVCGVALGVCQLAGIIMHDSIPAEPVAALAFVREHPVWVITHIVLIASYYLVVGFYVGLAGSFADRDVDITEENVQSRIRGVTLMALSNKFGPMLLTTGNKSEMSVGYATIYGDMAGGYNPLKDAYKMTVFAIAKWRNENVPRLSRNPVFPVMPDRIISKPPSAELRPDQKDEDSLPPYADLDRMLHMLVEEEASVDDVVTRYGFARDAVARIERLLMLAEYKRRQAPPGVKLSTRNFGRDRRYPITHGFRTA